MTQAIIRVPDLRGFIGELKAADPTLRDKWASNRPPIRVQLSISERGGEMVVWRDHELAAQAQIGDSIVWLVESKSAQFMHNGDPANVWHGSVASAMLDAKALVMESFGRLGFTVRESSFGLDKNIEPINGAFEILSWASQSAGSKGDNELVVDLAETRLVDLAESCELDLELDLEPSPWADPAADKVGEGILEAAS